MTTKMIRVDASHEGLLDSFIDENSEFMEIVEDDNIAYDIYFYERKEQLSQTMDAIDNGTMKLLSEDEFSTKMKEMENKLAQYNAD
jgi:hypothetical protein